MSVFRSTSKIVATVVVAILSIGLALGVAACSDAGDSIRESRGALTAEQSNVLGFEDVAGDWAASNGASLSSSSIKAEGEWALGVHSTGYIEFSSRPVPAPGGALNDARLSLRVPSELEWGEVRLIIEAPSQEIGRHDLGGVSVVGLSASEFTDISFPLSSSAREMLNSDADDVTFTIVLNAPSGGEFLFDDLRISSELTGSGVSSQTMRLSFAVPKGHRASEFLLSGSDSLVVGERSTIGAAGEAPLIAGLAAQGVHIGAATTVNGHVVSAGEVMLSSRTRIEGNVTASSHIREQDDVQVAGTVTEGGAVRSIEAGWDVSWPAEVGGDVLLEPDAPNLELPGGGHGSILVNSRATLTLRSGTYFIESLVVEPEAHLRLDTGHGPVILYVRDTLRLSVGLEYLAGSSENAFIGFFGTEPALFREAIEGTVIASNSSLELRRPGNGKAHRGAFFGKEVHVFSDASVEHVPFDFDSVCGSGQFDGAECVGEPGSPTDFRTSEVVLPLGVAPSDIIVAARESVEVGELAQVVGAELIVAVAEGRVSVGEKAQTPGIVAVAGVRLAPGATVNGDILADGTIEVAEAVAISGDTNGAAGVSPPVSYALNQAFPTPIDGDLLIAAGRSKIVLPGDYGRLVVEGSGTVYLRSGNYTFRDLIVNPGAQLIVIPDEGWVIADVSGRLELKGKVTGLGLAEPELAVSYGGDSPVIVGGQFGGGVVAPRSHLIVEDGPHQALFYGESVSLTEGVEVSGIEFPWHRLVNTKEKADIVVGQKLGLPGSLVGSSTARGEVSFSDGFDFVVPGTIPVNKGNAGNAEAVISVTREDASTFTCEYQGGAQKAHPDTLMGRALGRAYHLLSCSDGTEAGTVERATNVTIDIDADRDTPGGVTEVNLPLDKGCEGDLVPPIPLAESRRLIEAFEWPAQGEGLVPSEVNGHPSLFYTSIYITDPQELALLDRLLLHWDKRQLFLEEWPTEWENRCGTIHYDHDGVGVWVFAAMSGDAYNAILNARHEESIAPEDRELFSAVRILTPPAALATSVGSLDLELLNESGFEYRGLTGVPDAVALQEALFALGPGVSKALADAAKWVWDRAKKALQGISTVVGFLDKAYGTVSVHLDLNVLNTDQTFQPGSVLTRAWGVGSGNEISTQGARVNFWTEAVRLTSPLPIARLSRRKVAADGTVRVRVGRECGFGCGQVKFKRVCVELENRAGFVSTFLGSTSVCSDTFDETDFERFRKKSSVGWDISNKNARHLTETTDSFYYLREIVGEKAKKARVLVGPNAYILAGFTEGAAALCLGYGDVAPDLLFTQASAVFAGAASILGVPGVAETGAGAIGTAATWLIIVGNTDIVITSNHEANDTRGVTTHEYGHYALCDLVRKNGEEITPDIVLTFDTIRGGTGNPSENEDTRIVNEAFADFFSLQIVGGTNYNELKNKKGMKSSVVTNYMDFSIGKPGADTNLQGAADGEDWFIGRLVTMMQDLFDGRPFRNAGPTSGETWVHDGSYIQNRVDQHPITCGVNPADPSCRSGDYDLEKVMLGGASIREAIGNFQDSRNALGAYRVEAMEEGLIDTALSSTNWCQACLLAAPHFASFPNAPGTDLPYARSLITTCQNGALADYLGPPPLDPLEMDAFTCEACPAGTGMGAHGTCIPCPVDTTLVWGAGRECDVELVDFYSAPGSDICPDSFVVDIVDAASGFPVTSVSVVTEDTVDVAACEGSRLEGTVSGGSSLTTLTEQASFDIGGVPCSGGVCFPQCLYPDPSTAKSGVEVPFEPAVNVIRVAAKRGTQGVGVLVRNHTSSCPEITR